MMRRLAKDSAAEDDLIGIWVYTFREWGPKQAERYLSLLEAGIGRLLADPEDGRKRDAIRPGYRSKPIEHHLVFYTFDAVELRVRRVLHAAMDPDRHL